MEKKKVYTKFPVYLIIFIPTPLCLTIFWNPIGKLSTFLDWKSFVLVCEQHQYYLSKKFLIIVSFPDSSLPKNLYYIIV